MLIGVVALVIGSIDRILIAAKLPHEALGFFALATIIGRFISGALSDAAGVVLTPRVMEEAAKGDAGRLTHYLVQPTLLLAYFLPFLIGAAFLTIHLPLDYLLPEYSAAVFVCKIAILGAFFGCVPAASGLIFIALNKQMQVLMVTLAYVPVKAALSYALIMKGFGIGGVAIGAVAASALFGGALFGYASKLLPMSVSERWRFLVMAYIPFFYALGLLLVIDKVALAAISSVWMDIGITIVKLFIFSLAFALILIPMRRHPTFAPLPREVAALFVDSRKATSL